MHDWVVGASARQELGRRKSAHLSSVGKKSSLNRKRRRTKRTVAKRMHTAGRASDKGHGGSKVTSKWQ